MLFLDLFLPFGRADNAKIFQCVAETIIKAFRLRFPKIFTLDPDRLKQLKKFRYISVTDYDLWAAINYLDDQIFAQFAD